MGKKKNKFEIKLSEEELQPSVLGYLDESKKGAFGLIVLFLIFVIFAICLPYINTGINKLLGKDQPITPVNVEEKPGENNQGQNEVKIYSIDNNLSFEYNKINFSEVSLYQDGNKNYISILATNNSDELIDFGTSKYYLETYSEDKTLLGRHIFNNSKVNKKYGVKQILEISGQELSNTKNIAISYKTEKDYPEFEMKVNNEGLASLTCTNEVEKIIYNYDKKGVLTNIKDVINYANDNSNGYKLALQEYQNRAANYNNIEGVSSTIVEVSSGFTHTTDIVNKTVSLKDLNNDKYYDTKTTPKVIKFEMESRGYNCN